METSGRSQWQPHANRYVPPIFHRTSAIDASGLAARLADRGVHILDVRQPAEWRHGYIRGWQNLPLMQLKSRLDTLPREKTIVTVCASGHRSSSAVRTLQRAATRSKTSKAACTPGREPASQSRTGDPDLRHFAQTGDHSNGWSIDGAKRAQPVAADPQPLATDGNLPSVDGKEGVDGSRPSEGFRFLPA